MDRDFDGRLSFAEIMGEETPIEKLFKIMDKNGDGFVSKKVSGSSFFHRFAFSASNRFITCILATDPSSSVEQTKNLLCFLIFGHFQEFMTICKKLSKEQVILPSLSQKFDFSLFRFGLRLENLTPVEMIGWTTESFVR